MATFRLILGLLLIFTAGGCKPSDQDQPKVVSNASNMVNNTSSSKEDVIATMRVDLDRLKAQMNELGAKIESGSETVKAEAQPKLQTLRVKIADLDQQLDKAKDASASKWDEFKAGFEKSSADVKNSLSEARDWVSEKFSPAASTH